jgi:hypothetical protein
MWMRGIRAVEMEDRACPKARALHFAPRLALVRESLRLERKSRATNAR